MADRQTAEAGQTQLLRRVAAQDRQALGEFYDAVAGVLYSISFRILGDHQEAEEVIQDVFVQIWEKAATFDIALGTPLHWAVRIARNRSIDRLRSRQRRLRLIDEVRETAADDTGTTTFYRQPERDTEELTAIRAAVNGLPAEQRQAIEMAFFGGLTHAEIADAISQPLGTVKARIRRGMLKLRDSLQAYV